jgi:PKD repeat protein
MKKKFQHPAFATVMLLVFLSVIVATINCYAQKQTNKWYFGGHAALDFNSGSPVSISPGELITSEGSATISDTAGNLLFYTDGVTVWNKNNQQMVNGFGLTGNPSTSQSAFILPLPGSDSLYYLFTIPQDAFAPGLNYSIIDMSLQAGLGEVTVKNVFVLFPCTEKITAVYKPNKRDYWIITHGWNNNTFFSYELTSAGLNLTPVISNVGTIVNGYVWNTIGYLKAAPLGNKIAQAVLGGNYFELFDLDNNTGIVSNAITLSSLDNPSIGEGSYGVEFSADGSRLYGSVTKMGNVFQWDLNAGSSADIIASRILVGTSEVSVYGALQLASDGKIYLAEVSSPWLGVINNPNLLGSDCNFVDQGFLMTGSTNILGLPNNFPGFYIGLSAPKATLSASETQICQKFCLSFFDSSTNNPTSWQWSFPGGTPSSSTSQNPLSVCYSSPGTYDVTLITTNASGTDTVTLTDFITVNSTPSVPAIIQNGFNLTSTPASTYQWQFNSTDISGATNQSYDILQSGYYTVVISDVNGCNSSETMYVVIEGIDAPGNIQLSIYPNPSAGSFIVSSPAVCPPFCESGDIKAEVYNTLGQVVFSSIEKIHDQQLSVIIDPGDTPAGIYFLSLTQPGNKSSTSQTAIIKKLVVIK